MSNAVAPSPVAAASCFVEPARTSPAAKTPWTEVWKVGSVTMNPHWSRSILPLNWGGRHILRKASLGLGALAGDRDSALAEEGRGVHRCVFRVRRGGAGRAFPAGEREVRDSGVRALARPGC